MVGMCSPETQFYIIPLEGNRLNSIFSFSPLWLKYWSTAKTPFFSLLIASSLAADILLILKFSILMLTWQYIFLHHKCLSEIKKICRGKHMINWEIFYHCTSLPGTHVGQQQKQKKRNRNAWLFERSMEVSIWVHLSSLASNTFWVAAGDCHLACV